MKHFLILTLAFISFAELAMADSTKTMTISFKEDQFSFLQNDVGALEIIPTSKDLSVGFEENGEDPGLPWVAVDVKIPLDSTYNGVSATMSQRMLFENVVVAENPTVIYTDSIATETSLISLPVYKAAAYPTENVRYVMSSTMNDHVVLHFLVCPFVYEASSNRLNLAENITLNICLKAENTAAKLKGLELLKEKFPDFKFPEDITSERNSAYKAPPVLYNDSVDYVIITSDALSYYFEPWVQWKKQKGVKSVIVTVEDIQETNVSGLSTADAIKIYLSYMYQKNNIKYVLLGGDDTVVPIKRCHGYVIANASKNTVYKDDTLPSDLYYASLEFEGQDFFWDGNGNGICGELDDNISMAQNVHVTRLPVRTSTDVKAALIKFMDYEQNPTENGWNNNILMSGVQLSGNRPAEKIHSDAESTANIMYEKAIAPYWNGKRTKFYDTCSDYSNAGDTTVNRVSLQNLLSEGFTFFDMVTHGNTTFWAMQKGASYNVSDASALQNSKYTIITTTACTTNAFDSATDPCLSEAFIRNMYSGVVAYLGCSRYGWYYKDTYSQLGPSQLYEEQFYKHLFSSLHGNKNFGSIVAAAKTEMLSHCGSYNSKRWIQLGLNPIGDPEMPIYTETPVAFSGAKATIFQNNTVRVNTGIDSCTVCIMSSDNNGASYYEVRKNVCNTTFKNVRTDVSVCITKQNYIPKVLYLKQSDALACGSIDDCEFNKDNGHLDVTAKIDSSANRSLIKVSAASTGRTEKTLNISSDSPTVSTDASDMENGVHIVSLIVDGVLVDSKSIMKK